MSILRLLACPPGEIAGGKILFEDRDLLSLSNDKIREIRGASISMIFQEPMTALNPVFTVGEQIAEVFRKHKGLNRKEALAKSVEMLQQVRIPDASKAAGIYPHEMSGGMRQRAMIAMALACKPQILIADEPTTALDVTIQAQVIDLMKDLQQGVGMSVIFITHDLGVVANTANRVIVMYLGRIVEQALVTDLFRAPLHPYTQGLMASIPRVGDKLRGEKGELKEITGTVPSLLDIPPGCKFNERCPHVMDRCLKEEPELEEATQGRQCRCWLQSRRGGSADE
jgi:oligopeptide/dipeptide ABC transporter ATP-binding protein